MKNIGLTKTQLLSTLICASTLMGCASSYRRPESVADKMKRYQARSHSHNATPALPVIEGQKHLSWISSSNNRAPASVAPQQASSTEEQANDFAADQSHKRLYFLTLYSQYELLQQSVPEYQATQIRVCPHFHSSLVTHQESFGATSEMTFENKDYSAQMLQKIKKDESYLSLYPELALPMQAQTSRPRVIDLASEDASSVKKLVSQALSTHLSKTHSELSELCEFGSSDNYYIYENLMSSVEREGGLEKNVQGLQILLKTSTMFNHALISALNPVSAPTKSMGVSRAPASAQVQTQSSADMYAQELMRRLRAQWAQPYYSSLNSK